MRNRKNNPQYLIDRRRIKRDLHNLRTMRHRSVMEVVEVAYRLGVYFCTYYRRAERMAGGYATSLQHHQDLRLTALWRLLAAVSISELLETYQQLNVKLELKHLRGESFYAGMPLFTEEEIEIGRKFRALYGRVQQTVGPMISNKIENTYGVPEGEVGEKGYTVKELNDLPTISLPTPGGNVPFCPAMIMEDGKYHIYNGR